MNVTFSNPNTVTDMRKTHGISQAVRIEHPGVLIFLSGQLPYDRDGRLVGEGDIETQARQTFENIRHNLALLGASFENVVKMSGFVTDFALMPAIRKVRAEYVKAETAPVSTFVLVPRFANPGALLEIDVIATLPAA